MEASQPPTDDLSFLSGLSDGSGGGLGGGGGGSAGGSRRRRRRWG